MLSIVFGQIAFSSSGGAAPTGQAADIDQCRNGTFASPEQCIGGGSGNVGWVNGNAGQSNSHWREGEYIAYRARLTGLTPGNANHVLHIGWDSTQNNKHAIDYIGSFNATEHDANPCDTVSGCSYPNPSASASAPFFPGSGGPGGAITVTIPVDPMTSAMIAGHTQQAGVMVCWGCTTLNVSGTYDDTTLPFNKDQAQGLSFAFKSSVANPVFAWGGHIASQIDWGTGNSAVNISGSPYHSRIVALDGTGGSQDRSLSAQAVAQPPTLSTQVSNTTVGIGGTVTDTATFTGASGTVTGTATFFLCGPQSPASGCTQSDATRQQVGAVKTLSGGHATSDAVNTTNLALGTYCFGVLYTNDGQSFYANGYYDSSSQTASECFTVVQAPVVDVAKTADHTDPVNAGDTIGFTVTVSVSGTGTAHGVSLSDSLPGGNSGTPVTWSIASQSPASSFTLSGAAGSQTLTLTGQPKSLASGSSLTVHITAPTTKDNCATYNNEADVSSTDAGTDSASASETVNCADIAITKTANPTGPVDAGDTIGFDITVDNNGTGTAKGVTISDTLPAGGDLDWSLNPSFTGCAI
ncbi:MAG TPA: hypothetical protein VL856_04425, partial [Acidimicrobiia bacterium]|nr:hypothetical protein [Acidimicrobiia bacterium]